MVANFVYFLLQKCVYFYFDNRLDYLNRRVALSVVQNLYRFFFAIGILSSFLKK